jgi:hypothetical protein
VSLLVLLCVLPLASACGTHRGSVCHPDCQAHFESGVTTSGYQRICPGAGQCFQAYCRMAGGRGWTLVLTRGDVHKPRVATAPLSPLAGNGAALSPAQFAPLRSSATDFAFQVQAGKCGGGGEWGYGDMSKLTGGNNCANLGDDLTKCNLVHNERNGCVYQGSDYNGFFGTNKCNYFSDKAGVFRHWSSGGACAVHHLYASKADLYVTRKASTQSLATIVAPPGGWQCTARKDICFKAMGTADHHTANDQC